MTDHKPLVKIFGDRTLDEVSNSRLFLLKQRTLPWRFEIRHLPGKSNHAANATSRHPAPSGSTNNVSLETTKDLKESVLMSSICCETQEMFTIPWSLIAKETKADASLSHLLTLTEQNPDPLDNSDPTVPVFWPACQSLYIQEGVLLYQDRVVIPPSLCRQIIQHLHVGHQGTSTMEHRARAIVYWPGMSKDIRETKEGCADCDRDVPSKPATPPLPTQAPSTPFESVLAKFFDYGGHHYLVVGDRLLSWVEVFSSSSGTDLSGSHGLVRHIRTFFATFGVLEGGPEFTAGHMEDFLRRWGIRHRVSSVSFPQPNGRVKVAVKTTKRLLMSNTGPTGSLNHDRFFRAML